MPAQPEPTDTLLITPHSRLHREHHNVKAYGAVGNGVSDDTTPFVDCITAANEQDTGRSVFIPPGTYIIDGDAILTLLDGKESGVITGAGYLQSIIVPKAGASCAFGVDGAVGYTFRGIEFRGNIGAGQDAFRMYGNSRGNMFDSCRFNLALRGFYALEDPGSPGSDQNERTTFLNCHADNSTTGYRITGSNSDGILWLGGGASNCAVAAHLSGGDGTFINWFGGSGSGVGTCYKTDTAWTGTTLIGCLDENFDISYDLGAGNLWAQRTYFQGVTNTIKCGAGASRIQTANCVFNGGDFNPGAGSTWWSTNDAIAGVAGGTGTYTPNASAQRVREEPGHRFVYNGTTEMMHDNWGTGLAEPEQVTAPKLLGTAASFGNAAPTPGSNAVVELRDDSSSQLVSFDRHETDSTPNVRFRRARDASADLQNNDVISRIEFWARNQGGFNFPAAHAAMIDATVDASPGATFAPSRMQFYTAGTSGSSGAVERLRLDSGGNLRAMTAGAAFELLENGTTDAAAGAANTGRLYVRDNGSGKTQLCVRFNTGDVQVIATEA